MESKSVENKGNVVIPFLNLVSNNFKKDLGIVKKGP
jgi:hypothetical protein